MAMSARASRGATDESTCTPGPVPTEVGGGHPSRPAVTGRLQRPTRRLGRAVLERLRRSRPWAEPSWPCSGWGLPSHPGHPGCWWSLTPPFHPYPARLREAVCSLWHFPAGRPGLPLTTTLPCGVRTFLGDGCPSTRPPGQLVRPDSLLGP